MSLKSRAQISSPSYGRRVQADDFDALTFYRENFAGGIRYQGKRISNRQLVTQQRRFVAQWPHRAYRIKPETTRIVCNVARSYCDVSGQYDFRISGRHRKAHGVASFAFRVAFTPSGPKVVSQNGHVLSQR